MVSLLLAILLQIGNISDFDITHFLLSGQKIESFNYRIGSDYVNNTGFTPFYKNWILNDITCCCQESNFNNKVDRFTSVLNQFQGKFSNDISLSAIVIRSFLHDRKYSPTIFVIIKTNDNQNGIICYISEKDSFKSDSLNSKEIKTICSFIKSSTGISLSGAQDDATSFYMKTIDFNSNQVFEAYFNGVSNFDLNEIEWKNPTDKRLHIIADQYNELNKLLSNKTTAMRCK